MTAGLALRGASSSMSEPVLSNVPIADHALLSDCHSAAMVTRDGFDRLALLPSFRLTGRIRQAPGRECLALAHHSRQRAGCGSVLLMSAGD